MASNANDENVGVAASGDTGSGSGNIIDVWIGLGTGGAFLFAMILFSIFAWRGPLNDGAYCLLSGSVGAVLGWGFGVLISPYNVTEDKAFRGLGQAVYGLITGYMVAKLDPLITVWASEVAKNGIPGNVLMFPAVGLTCFMAVALATYISRRYWL